MPFGASQLGFGVSFMLEDGFSGPSKKIKENFDGLDKTVTKSTSNISKNMGGISKDIGGLAIGTVLVAGFTSAINQSAKLSDELADVTKTTGITGQSLQDLRNELESIDTRTSLSGLLGIATAGGSLGVAQEDIGGFTKAIDKLNVALGDQFSSPEDLARGIAQLSNNLKDINSGSLENDLLSVGNVLNFMGANAKATESTIFDITNRLVGLQSSANLSSAQIFGISTAMAETGLSSEVLGSNISLAMGRMLSNTDKFADAIGVSRESFKELANKDSLAAFDMVAKKIKEQNPLATDFNEKLKSLGLTGALMSNVFIQYAENIDNVKNRINQAGEALGNTDSIMGEFNAKNQTLQAVLDKGGKKLMSVFVSLGDALAPVVKMVINLTIPLLSFFAKMAKSSVGQFLIVVAGGIVAVVGGMAALGSVMSFVTPALAVFGTTLSAAIWPVTLIVAAIVLFVFVAKKAWGMITEGNEKMVVWGNIILGLLGPVGMVISLVANLTRGFSEFNKVSEGGELKGGFIGFLTKVAGVLTGVKEIWDSFDLQGFTLSSKTEKALDKIGMLDTVKSIGAWMVKGKRFINDFSNGFVSAIKSIGEGFSMMWDDIKNGFSELFQFFSSAIETAVNWFRELYNSTGVLGTVVRVLLAPIKLFFSVLGVVGNRLGVVFDNIKNKIVGIWDSVKGFMSSIGKFFDISDQVVKVEKVIDEPGKITQAKDPRIEGLSNASSSLIVQQEKARAKNGSPTVNVTPPENRQPIVIKNQVSLDGRPIAESVNEVNEFDEQITD